MDLLQMRYFLEVAASEHVTNSAKKLHIAQPALTQAIKRLEEELGVELFERAGRNIRLTPAGAYLRDRISPAIESFATLCDDVRAFTADEERTVRIGIFSASNAVVDALAAYTSERGGMRPAFRITQDELDQTCDITVTTVRPSLEPSPAPVAADCLLLAERIGVAVPNTSSYGDVVSLNELANERFICLAGSRQLRAVCDALCAGRAFSPRIGFESDSPAAVRKIIGLGLGVGFWPACSWETLEGSDARFARLAEPEFERTVIVARAAHVQPHSEAAQFYTFLTEYLQERWRARQG